MQFEVGFLGYGAMAGAISGGLAASGLVPYERQIISDLDTSRVEKAVWELGVTAASDNKDLVGRAKTIILGVKPHQISAVLKEIKETDGRKLFISLAAGVKLETIRPLLPTDAGLVRSMPNISALVGCGTILICAPPETQTDDIETARKIFESVGECLQLPEASFDAGTAVSGSGPAYFFEFMENMIRGAVRLGLTWDDARRLVVGTALGAAEMARQKPTPLAELRDMVTSPGGTTAEALYVFEKGGLGGLIQEALEAAAEKSRKLS